MVKNRILYSIGVICAVVYFIYSRMWMSYFLLIVVVCLPVLSFAIGLAASKKLSYSIYAPAEVKRGEQLTVVIADESRTGAVSYEVVLEVNDGSEDESVWTAGLYRKEKRGIKAETEHCRMIRCSVKKAYACDLLGIFRFRLPAAHDSVTAVMPIPSPPVPMPELSRVIHTSYRPKYGGGFAEQHDMREYRTGDSMRDIHWKLSAKTDRLIVREPQTPNRGIVLITFDPLPPSDEMDRILDRAAWLSRRLLESETEHDIRWISPVTREVVSVTVAEKGDFSEVVRSVLSEPAAEDRPSIVNISFRNTEWRYHINGEASE